MARKKTREPIPFGEVMRTLEAEGTAQHRKIYGRHGVSGDMFGVSYTFLRKYAKKAGPDQGLALELWSTQNHDARVLATMVADPAAFSKSELDSWMRDVQCYPLADAFCGMVGRSPLAQDRVKKWIARKTEYPRRCGYSTMSAALSHGVDFGEDWLRERMAIIEAEIHASPNRARQAMNTSLIAIGTYVDALYDEALAAAKRIGPVEVDHGETGCKTFEAVSYIQKAAAHRRAQASKAQAKATSRRRPVSKR